MYNSDLVRKLCGDILNPKDPGRVQDLISLLQAVIKEDQEAICGKPIALERAKVSEEGKPVHEECLVAKIRLSQRHPPATD
jgi:hypothetical protein